MSKLVEATHVTLGGEVGSPDAWARPYLDDDHMRYASTLLNAASSQQGTVPARPWTRPI